MTNLKKSKGQDFPLAGLANRCGKVLDDLTHLVLTGIDKILAEPKGARLKFRPALATVKRRVTLKMRGQTRPLRFK